MTVAAEFREVSKLFGEFVAVDGVSLTIEHGQLTTLLGPSGCGKTTSLRMLAGYERPTAGSIHINGNDATSLPPERRNLGMVFQSYALFPHLTAAANVEFGLKIRKMSAAERGRRVGEALELVGLAHLSDRKPKKLSGGQQQRVALARAIAIRPDVLLLDEPLSNLDARLRVEMRGELRRIQAETGQTVVLVTHDQDEALEMSDVMVVMRDGKIVQRGAPVDVFESPVDEFVAKFLGYENILGFGDGRMITFRPEHIGIHPEQAEVSGGLQLDATMVDHAYRGVDILATFAALNPHDETPVTIKATARPSELPVPVADLGAGGRFHLHVPDSRLVTLRS